MSPVLPLHWEATEARNAQRFICMCLALAGVRELDPFTEEKLRLEEEAAAEAEGDDPADPAGAKAGLARGSGRASDAPVAKKKSTVADLGTESEAEAPVRTEAKALKQPAKGSTPSQGVASTANQKGQLPALRLTSGAGGASASGATSSGEEEEEEEAAVYAPGTKRRAADPIAVSIKASVEGPAAAAAKEAADAEDVKERAGTGTGSAAAALAGGKGGSLAATGPSMRDATSASASSGKESTANSTLSAARSASQVAAAASAAKADAAEPSKASKDSRRPAEATAAEEGEEEVVSSAATAKAKSVSSKAGGGSKGGLADEAEPVEQLDTSAGRGSSSKGSGGGVLGRGGSGLGGIEADEALLG